MTKVYYASGLFSEADRDFNAKVAKRIRQAVKGIDVYLPQENMSINDKSKYADSKMIAKADFENLDNSDLIIVNLDGIEYAQGRCVEVGYAVAKGIPVIGLWTDNRQQGSDVKEKVDALSEIGESQFAYINLMLVGAIKLDGAIYNNVDEFVQAIETELKKEEI